MMLDDGMIAATLLLVAIDPPSYQAPPAATPA